MEPWQKKLYTKSIYFNSHQEIETTLSHLPKPGRHHLDTLQHLVLRVEAEWGIGSADVQHREAVAERVNRVVVAGIQGRQIIIYSPALFSGPNVTEYASFACTKYRVLLQ